MALAPGARAPRFATPPAALAAPAESPRAADELEAALAEACAELGQSLTVAWPGGAHAALATPAGAVPAACLEPPAAEREALGSARPTRGVQANLNYRQLSGVRTVKRKRAVDGAA